MDQLVRNFRRSIIIAELRWPDVVRRWKNLFCFWKTTTYRKIIKIPFRKVHRDIDGRVLFKFREIWLTGNGKVVLYLHDKKTTKFRLAVQLSLLRRSRRKSAVASPRQCTQSAQDFIQIRSLSAELYPNARTPSESESNIRLKPNFEPNKN